MLFREIDESEFTQGTKEPELKEDNSIDHLKYLVDHFRKLSNDKDAIIRQYREMLERVKPSFEREEFMRRRILDQNDLIQQQKKKIDKLENKKEKKVKKSNSDS
jgi:hypothetical protein